RSRSPVRPWCRPRPRGQRRARPDWRRRVLRKLRPLASASRLSVTTARPWSRRPPLRQASEPPARVRRALPPLSEEPRQRAGRSNTKLRRSRPPQQDWPASGRTHYASLLFPNTQLTERPAIHAKKVLTPYQRAAVW